MRILLIEDDEVQSNIIARSLRNQRYAVDRVEDGQLGWEYAQDGTHELLLIDVGLPRLDGITLCQRLRSGGCSTPILLMTAKNATEERIRGLDAGADDYLTKPLDLGELHARIRALLRRGEVAPRTSLEVGALCLDPLSCEVTFNGKLLTLTTKEYSLLELFLRNPSRVFSRDQIIDHLWTFDDPPLEESVKGHIKGLRRKLKAAGALDWIENVYGLGYKLNPKLDIPASPAVRLPQMLPLSNLGSFQPAPSVEHAFDQAMDKLWQQYRGLMTERLVALQIAADAIQSGALSIAVRQTAKKAAHKLAGVLGMFGREAGTQLAKEIEQLLEDELTGDEQVPALVQQLEELLGLSVNLALPASQPSVNNPRLLLISPNQRLATELQQLAQEVDLSWQVVTTIEDSKQWLQAHLPELVVIDLNPAEQPKAGLALLAELAARTPPVPSIVLANTETLEARLQITEVGVQNLLSQPVTATQIWQVATQMLQQCRTQSTTILAVDDDPVLLGTLRSMLEPWGMQVTTLDDPAYFWQVLQGMTPDLLVLDVEMPTFSGVELCQAVRSDPAWQDLPVVFLTAHRDAETVQQVFAAGADDYIAKPILGPELLTRITNRLERTRLLRSLASRDPRTGLANQPQSSRGLEQLIQSAAVNHTPVAFLLLQLLDLPNLNLCYGHTTGNQILQHWGSILQSALRGAEVLGYWDNGEFVVGMPEMTKVTARDRCASILKTFRKQIFTAPDGSRFQVNYSLGIAEYPLDGQNVQMLYQVARSAADQS